jgi:hypothetical protein
MTKPIHFRGIDYANVEAMPSDERMAYGEELFQAGAKEAANADEQITEAGDPQPEPVWGGKRAAGGKPVPVEFDAVTTLGPAAAVHLRAGGPRLPNLGAPRPDALVIYRVGVAYRTGRELHTWRWEEVAVIQSNVWYLEHITDHEYSLIKSSGEKIILDNGLKDIEDAIEPIKKAVFARLLPPLTHAYGSGQAVTFGAVTIKKQTGMQLDGKSYAWNAILDVKADKGRFAVTLRDSKKHEVRSSAIPNIELMAQLIGLKYTETAYA